MTDSQDKKKRSRTINRLSARAVETATKPGIYLDGGGLLLRVSDSGNKKWLFRYASPLTGKRREIGFGPAGKGGVSLAVARDKAQKARDTVAKKHDPLEEAEREKSARQAATLTFGEFAKEWLDLNVTEKAFRNAKHRAQWRSTLETHGKPLWDKALASVSTDDVLKCLRPIWQDTPETAKRTQGRIERLLDAAIARGLHSGPNPARWRRHLSEALPARSKRDKGHHAALPHKDLPAFIAALREREGVAARALEFLILTAARSGEVRGMIWGELDMAGRRWTVPVNRMKAGKEHRVPLSDQAMEIISAMAPLRPRGDDGSALVFPGAKNAVMSDMTLASALKRMGRGDITVHGFRSCFRDWAEDVARYPYGAIKAALAHTISDNTDAAYRRGDGYDIRKELMAAWGKYLAIGSVQQTAEVLIRGE
jgi:integrase